MNEIAITGSTGVIGRRAVREVLAAGHRVRGVTTTALTAERNARELSTTPPSFHERRGSTPLSAASTSRSRVADRGLLTCRRRIDSSWRSTRISSSLERSPGSPLVPQPRQARAPNIGISSALSPGGIRRRPTMRSATMLWNRFNGSSKR
jgi:hypothetical protein